jgi:hypothetical protein
MNHFHRDGGRFKSRPTLQSQKANQQLRNQRPEGSPRSFDPGVPYNFFRSRLGYTLPIVPFAGRAQPRPVMHAYDTTEIATEASNNHSEQGGPTDE